MALRFLAGCRKAPQPLPTSARICSARTINTLSQERWFSGRAGFVSPKHTKAAAVIIGNEVLNGSVLDVNTHTLARLLFDSGIDLVRVETIPDEPSDITQTVSRLSQAVGPEGLVFTSGGIGVTHDDVTYAAVAAAFGCDLELHEPTREKMMTHMTARNEELAKALARGEQPTYAHFDVENPANLRMATLPRGCRVLPTPGLWVPLVVLGNVWVLPGIPDLFRNMLEANREVIATHSNGVVFHRAALLTQATEGEVAVVVRQAAALRIALLMPPYQLARVQEQFPTVKIGSYPRTKPEHTYRTKLSFEGPCREIVIQALEAVKQHVQGEVDHHVPHYNE